MLIPILSNAFLWENFSACANLFQDFVNQKEAQSLDLTIATVGLYQQHHKEGIANHQSKFNKNFRSSSGSGKVAN